MQAFLSVVGLSLVVMVVVVVVVMVVFCVCAELFFMFLRNRIVTNK